MSEPRPQTIIVFARLFRGLADSLADRSWQPVGVPAIYRLLERLADEPGVTLVTVFAAKDPGGRFEEAAQFDLHPIGRIHILPYRSHQLLARLRLQGKWIELSHLLRSLILLLRYRPAIAYFTNAHFVTAGLVARFWRCRTVFRFLGLTPVQHRIARGANRLARWFYRAPFDQVICTLDGSGTEFYLPALLRPGVPTAILLNGVDRPQPPTRQTTIENRPPLILFVGRIEAQKGAEEFVAAMIEIARRRPDAARAVLVGDGSERQNLIRKVAAAGLDAMIELPGAVPHRDIAGYLGKADIYVSLNKFGNLSNANLEAFAAGRCMIVLDRDPATHIDEETEAVLPTEIVLRIPRDDIARHLADQVIRLIDNPAEIERRARQTRDLADRVLQSWDSRIDAELSLIRGTGQAAHA